MGKKLTKYPKFTGITHKPSNRVLDLSFIIILLYANGLPISKFLKLALF